MREGNKFEILRGCAFTVFPSTEHSFGAKKKIWRAFCVMVFALLGVVS
jgi:hypothetical protein